ncbi:hypothetical protein ACM25P_02650 [Vreelandella alkaliphila]|uniref:hypothetical protein n=1 Tax=Vreelandella alkaliphila TaxID=272774 RepID=UPI0039F49446
MTQTHFMANIPGVRPQPLRANVPGELTEQELKEAIHEGISKPMSDLAEKVQAIAERDREIKEGIAAASADQKARGIYREPQTTVVNQRQYSAPQDTLPD